jgi:hypothetical protein
MSAAYLGIVVPFIVNPWGLSPHRRTSLADFDDWVKNCLMGSGRQDNELGVTIDDVRELASTLERSYEVLVRDRVKFRVGQIVYLAFSRDETVMGFAFPKEERAALVDSEPHKFMLPPQGDMRYNWVVVRLAEIDHDEMVEIVIAAWRMVGPKKVFNAFDRQRTGVRATGAVDS